MKKLLEYIIEGITGSDDFSVEENVEENFHELTVHANPDLIGMIIGKNGKTINTIRNLLKVRAVYDKTTFNLSVAEKNNQSEKENGLDLSEGGSAGTSKNSG
jgi:predicted RNA-binding protein YlqC (UPF0109 family)